MRTTTPVVRPLPADDLAGYLRAYVEQSAFGDQDPGEVLERYHVPEVTWSSDGMLLDRDRLVAHARPTRKNVLACEVEVHDALRSADRVAARYTLRATMRKGRSVTMEVHMFGRLAADGRLREVRQLTRTVEERRTP